MNLAKEPVGLKLPPPIGEAWNRLASGGGSPPDLRNVVDFLAKLWASDQMDPRTFEVWLADQGLANNGLPLVRRYEYRKIFERERETQTRNLIEGITLGPHSREVFSTLMAGISTELRRLVYRTAISVSRDEGLVFVLVALSQEGPQLAREWVSGLPGSPILQVFLAYLNGAHLPLALDERWSPSTDSNGQPGYRLFRLATLPLKAFKEAFSTVPRSEIETLVRIAESLLECDKNDRK